MKTFNEYVAETTAPIIMDAVRMQKYEKRIRSARIEKRKRTMRSDKSISIVKNTLKKRVPARSINSDVEKYFEVA